MPIYCKHLVILATLMLSINISAQKGHDILVKIPNLKNQSILLGHYFGNQSGFADDTIKLDNRGTGSFKGSKPLPQGIYFILLPSKMPIDILIGDNQCFTIELDTTNIRKTLKFSGSKECDAFAKVQQFKINTQIELNSLMGRYKNAKNTEKDSLRLKLKDLNHKDEEFVKDQLKNLPPNSMLSILLKATQEVNIPDFPRDTAGNITDSTFQYHYLRAHYFDNFDFTDARLLRTPIYEQKIKNYLEKIIPPFVDTINIEVDKLLDNTLSNSELFRYLLGTLYNQYGSSQIVGMDAVFVHIVEKYYIPHATWSSKDFVEKLKTEVDKLKPTLIGQYAPNIKLVELPSDHFLVAKTDSALKSNPYLGNFMYINNIEANFLVIVFWEADCGHCQKAMPVLHEAYQRLKEKGVVVLAVHAISSVPGKRKWIDYVNEHEFYDWINAWSPYSNEYRDLYNLQAFPAIFILDKNKKIVSKRIGAEQVENIINFELQKKNQEQI